MPHCFLKITKIFVELFFEEFWEKKYFEKYKTFFALLWAKY